MEVRILEAIKVYTHIGVCDFFLLRSEILADILIKKKDNHPIQKP